ncbi:MAG: hypothetical protein RLZZ135_398, partial [Cyanobacteriota bacterium]
MGKTEKNISKKFSSLPEIDTINTVGISVNNVSKRFGSFQAVENVNLEIESGSLVAL